MAGAHGGEVLFGALEEGGFLFGHGIVSGKFLLDFLDAFDENLDVGFGFAFRGLFLNGGEIFEFVGVRAGEVEGKFGTSGTDEFIEDTGRENDGLKGIACGTAEGTCAEGGKTDRDAGLRDEGETEVIADVVGFLYGSTAGEGSAVLSGDADGEVDDADDDQRYCADRTGGMDEGVKIETGAGADEEEEEQRRAEVIELFEEIFVVRDVDVDSTHGHTAEEGGDVAGGTDTAEGKQERDGDDEAVILGTVGHEELHEQTEEASDEDDGDIDENGSDDIEKIDAGAFRRRADGDGDAEEEQTDDVVNGGDLQKAIDKVALGSGLADGHHGGRRRNDNGEGGQRDGQGEVHAQQEEHCAEDERRGDAGLDERYDHDTRSVAAQDGHPEKFTGGKRDERKRDIGKEIHSLNNILRHKIKAVRADQYPDKDVRRNVRQLQPFRDPRHRKAQKQHEGHSRDHDCGGGYGRVKRGKHNGISVSLLSVYYTTLFRFCNRFIFDKGEDVRRRHF